MERLTSEQMQEVLARAEEIRRQEEAKIEWTNELEQWVHAAEEAGISRPTLEQALRERFSLYGSTLEPGEHVFAKSKNGRFYAAKLLSLEESVAKVEFVSGGECRLPISELRPFSLLPGEKVECDWANWGWWTCTVTSYDKNLMKVYANDGWGTTQGFDISQVRLNVPEPGKTSFASRFGLVVGPLLAGTAIGTLITWLVMRG
ncbi:MAG: hypothetical protein KF784_04040 [Fimbriimonadaceae bacterium]|nr:hypothetical protein [Fimbriimonadaceae bacterium]